MRFNLPKYGNHLPRIITTISVAKLWFIHVYPQIENYIIWFCGLFAHDVAKHFYRQFIRAIEFAWAIFIFFLGYQVFLAGAIRIQPNSNNGDMPVVMTVGLATTLVNAFFALLALGTAWSIFRTIQFSRDWIKGKRPATLTAISQKLELTEVRLDAELTGINKRLDNIETILKDLVKDKKRGEKTR